MTKSFSLQKQRSKKVTWQGRLSTIHIFIHIYQLSKLSSTDTIEDLINYNLDNRTTFTYHPVEVQMSLVDVYIWGQADKISKILQVYTYYLCNTATQSKYGRRIHIIERSSVHSMHIVFLPPYIMVNYISKQPIYKYIYTRVTGSVPQKIRS